MNIKDVNDTMILLFFYTDRHSSELTSLQVQKEYIIAILYAQHHTFMFSESEIHHEELTNIKILL